jgi:MFS transporter, DHA1 family, inner membrane transport protein
LSTLPWVGVLMACGAFGLTLLSASLDRRARRLSIGQAA